MLHEKAPKHLEEEPIESIKQKMPFQEANNINARRNRYRRRISADPRGNIWLWLLRLRAQKDMTAQKRERERERN